MLHQIVNAGVMEVVSEKVQVVNAFKKIIDDDWRQQANLIYQQYEIYAQAGGAEQAVFDPTSKNISRRSSQLLECFIMMLLNQRKEHVLNILHSMKEGRGNA